jgi:four helix bundle protein
VRDHRKLKTFHLADRLALTVYQSTRSFPKEENFGLTSQVRRAAVSIASNIVEGCARHTEQEYLRFLDTAYGSARELEYQLSLAKRLGYLGEQGSSEVLYQSEEVGRALHGLIRSIRSRRTAKSDVAAEDRSA